MGSCKFGVACFDLVTSEIRRRLLLAVVVLGALYCPQVQANERLFDGYPAAEVRGLLDRCYRLETDVEERLDALEKSRPSSLLPGVLRLGVVYWKANYKEMDAALEARYEATAAALLEKAGQRLKASPEDVDAAYVSALAQMHLGFYHASKQHWWSAFWKVRAGRKAMLKVLEEHPDYVDAKMPTGLADCFLAKTPVYLKPAALLLNTPGNMDRGLRRLKEAKAGLVTAVEASFYLAVVDGDLLKDLPAAREEMAELAARYPENPFFVRVLGECELGTGKTEEGRLHLQAAAYLEASRLYPAQAVHSWMSLCWSFMSTKEYGRAWEAAENAGRIADAEPGVRHLLTNTLFGRAEAQKALGNTNQAFDFFSRIPLDDKDGRAKAAQRVHDIKKEMGLVE